MVWSPISKGRKIVKSNNLTTLTNIATVDAIIDKKVNKVAQNIRDKYRIDEDELYEKLYLKVRKMFVEEE